MGGRPGPQHGRCGCRRQQHDDAQEVWDFQSAQAGIVELQRDAIRALPVVVLADNLGKATVDLKIYFWLNGREHSPIKVRSSVIRLVKRAFQQSGITMPDEAREVVFPQSVPVVLLQDEAARRTVSRRRRRRPTRTAPSRRKRRRGWRATLRC